MIGFLTKGWLQFFMSKYIPTDEFIMEIDEEVLDGTIEDLISGELTECDR